MGAGRKVQSVYPSPALRFAQALFQADAWIGPSQEYVGYEVAQEQENGE